MSSLAFHISQDSFNKYSLTKDVETHFQCGSYWKCIFQVNKTDGFAFEKFFLGRTKNFSYLAIFQIAGWSGLFITENEYSIFKDKDTTKILNLKK